MSHAPYHDVPPRQGLSSGQKWLIGCSIGCVGSIVIVVVCATLVARWGIAFANKWMTQEMQPFLDQGYAQVTGQAITVTAPITQPTLFMAQTVDIQANSTANIAMFCQVGSINSTIDGQVDFRGQALTISPQAHLKKGLDVKAQMVTVYGQIDGPITGAYQTLSDMRPRAPASGEAKPSQVPAPATQPRPVETPAGESPL